MAFQLSSVVPWGRNFDEYKRMFQLTNEHYNMKIASFGDGPASFNFEGTNKGYSITSFDPIYQFKQEELKNRIEETRIIVMKQMAENMDHYNWNIIKNLDQLESIRMSAMNLFLDDYKKGLIENRYINYELPNHLDISDDYFDLGLSSHFLLMYTALGYDFHILSINEMLRVCKEVRIFPLVDLDSQPSKLISSIIDYYRINYKVEIKETDYEFQKGANRVLIIKK